MILAKVFFVIFYKKFQFYIINVNKLNITISYMKIYLSHCHLTSLGLMSIFRPQKFILAFKSSLRSHSLVLNAKKGFLGYVFEHFDKNMVLNVFINNNIVDTKEVDLCCIDKFEFDNPFFKGYILIRKFQSSFFLELERSFSKNKHSDNLTYFSKSVERRSKLLVRKLYTGNVYFVNVEECSAKFLEEDIFDVKLSPGWERGITNHGVYFYIDHDSRTTQWTNPMAKGAKLNSCINKILDVLHDKPYFYPEKTYVLEVDRNFAIQSSYKRILESIEKLKDLKLKIKFKDEIGCDDGGGLFREYLELVSEELALDSRISCCKGICDIEFFSVDEECTQDPCFYKKVNRNRNHLKNRDFLMYIGIILGLSFKNYVPLKINFSLHFYESILNKEYSIRKVQDTIYQSSLLKILRGEEKVSFSMNIDLTTAEKRRNYVENILYEKYLIKKDQYSIVQNGFFSLIPRRFKNMLSSEILNLMVTGYKRASIAELKSLVKYVNCTSETKEIRFLWDIIEREGYSLLSKILRFCTGSSTISNTLILRNQFKLTIEQLSHENMLFRSSACVYTLWIGKYDSIESIKEKLLLSIEESSGFHKI